jgi:hypothetical protein
MSIDFENAYFLKNTTESRPIWLVKQIYNLIINGVWEKRLFRFQISILKKVENLK